MTFEFDYLLDPIGPDQAPGASRFVPADAMTPTPGGSNDQPCGAATGVDADAWLIELLTERAPPAPTTTYEDMTWLDEPVGAAAVPTALPRPVLDTRVDLPPPAALAGLAGLAALIPGTDRAHPMRPSPRTSLDRALPRLEPTTIVCRSVAVADAVVLVARTDLTA